MRRALLAIVALGVMVAVSVAGVATAGNGRPVHVRVGNIELTASGGFSPTTLSKTKPTPIGLSVGGEIKTLDNTHPPAVKEVLIETDKSGAIDVKGYPVCRSGQLQATDSAHAEQACGPALIGDGNTTVEILFEESQRILTHSKLLVFNGGFSGGVTTLLVHAYITFPVPVAVVTTVKIKKIHKGPFGLLSTATIPAIAGGNGSITAFALDIKKSVQAKGRTFHILTLKCPTGRIAVHATAVFSDDTRASADVPRTCRGKK